MSEVKVDSANEKKFSPDQDSLNDYYCVVFLVIRHESESGQSVSKG